MIDLRNICKTYQNVHGETLTVLQLSEFSISQGEIVGVAGVSGSGKTTLINIVAGILAPDSGEVIVKDEQIYDLSEVQRDRFRADHLGYVFQSFNLIPSLSALDNVLAAMSFSRVVPRRERLSRAKNLLAEMGLAERSDHLPHQLSGGEQQRVSIARALANKPEILLADEPTANLDAKNRKIVSEVILKTRAECNLTVLLASHDAELLHKVDRICYLQNGEVSYAL